MSQQYVAYYRVSTLKQGRSGLGLKAQKHAVETFYVHERSGSHQLPDIESGRKNERPSFRPLLPIAKYTEPPCSLRN